MSGRLGILAIVTVRNGEAYVRRCLEHLISQEVDVYLVDHGSTDRTRSLAEEHLGHGVVGVDDLPFEGHAALRERLEAVRGIVAASPADWFINCDIDEIMEAPAPFRTLREGIEAADAGGFNVINFDEFIFLPTSPDEDHEGGDYVATMTRYYHFSPGPQRLMRAFRKPEDGEVDFVSSGGHRVRMRDLRVYPENFIKRHYIALSRRQLLRKYLGRVHELAEVRARGWSAGRAAIRPSDIVLPDRERLEVVDPGGRWDRGDPWRRHEFLGDPGRLRDAPLVTGGEGRARAGEHPPMPVIVGARRSGTRVLRRMLDAHPGIAIAPATGFVPRLARLERGDRAGFARAVTGARSWARLDLDRAELMRELERIEPFDVADGLRALYRLHASRHGKSRWGEATPRYGLRMEAIAALLPEARFIHLIRDGRDVALPPREARGPGERVEDRAADWVWRIREARQQASALPHYLEVRHEDLVSRPEPVLREVCDYIDLPFDASMLDRRGTGRTTGRSSRRPSELPRDDRREFEAIAAEMLRDLGYEA